MKNIRIPVPTMIDIDDVAHSLANIGDTSVAQRAIIEIVRQVAQTNFTYQVARQLMYALIDDLADNRMHLEATLRQFNDDLAQYVANRHCNRVVE